MVSSFVGRRDELAALMTLAGRLAEGHSIAGVIVGDPGSGKTRLLNEFRQRVTEAELPAVAGFETARGLPPAPESDEVVPALLEESEVRVSSNSSASAAQVEPGPIPSGRLFQMCEPVR